MGKETSQITEKEALSIYARIRYKFRTRVEYSSDTPIRINDWRVADCLRSTIDGQLVPALSRNGLERHMPFLIRAVCGDMG